MLSERRYLRALAAISCAAVLAGAIGIDWGLPNGNTTWAADSVAPMTPLSVAYHVFAEHGFDSGYFYFKYPVGHQLLLAAASAPVLAAAKMRGELHGISSDYPYGFSDPEFYLAVLALVTRALSTLLAAGILLAVAGIAHRLSGDRRAGVLAALVAAGSYPLVFYAHTSNVETAFLFWAFTALYATVRGLEGDQPRWFWLLGASAALAVSTKEQIFGFVVPLPLLIAAVHLWRPRAEAATGLLPRGTVAGAALSVVVLLAVNAAFYNPSGFLNRYRFLTHTLSPEVRALYANYEFPVDFSTSWTLVQEVQHVGKALHAVATSLGWPGFAAGLGGLVLLAFRNRYALVCVALPLVGYYVVSLRVLKQVEIRYTMPISTLLAVPAGVLLAFAWQRARGARIAVTVLVLAGLLHSGEVLPMLTNDARYRAEAWMAPHLAAGRTLEVYQSWTYLPRWQALPTVSRPAFAEMNVAGLTQRAPDFVVLSSKAREGIYMYPNPDWRDGRGMMLEAQENRQLLDSLETGRLGYQQVARFEHPLLIRRELITSLNPAITIYRRTPAAR